MYTLKGGVYLSLQKWYINVLGLVCVLGLCAILKTALSTMMLARVGLFLSKYGSFIRGISGDPDCDNCA